MERPELEEWLHRVDDEALLAEELKIQEMKQFLGTLTLQEAEAAEYSALICPDVAGRDI